MHVLRRMSGRVLKANLSPATGEMGWVLTGDDYDYAQEIARSGYGDMLYDKQRNEAYEAALKSVIKEKLQSDGRADVLDIGTGTGLLSMMGLRAGATSAQAVEAFPPMAACSAQVTKANEYEVRIHSCRSTDLPDLPAPKPNICVAEVFDTELIGEGAIRTFKDALQRLLAPGARVIPSRGEIRIQGIESSFLRRWDRLPPTLGVGGTSVRIPEAYAKCPGNVSIHDLQLDAVPASAYKLLTPPVTAFKFNFESENDLIYDETWSAEVCASDTGRLDGLLFWWDLDMDGSGQHIISTQPSFLYPPGQEQPWRDHWLGAVVYLPETVEAVKGSTLRLTGTRDEFSLWFAAEETPKAEIGSPLDRPSCSCGLHLALSRRHMAWASDAGRYEALISAMDHSVNNLLVIGEGSLLGPLLSAKWREKSVSVLCPEPRQAAFLRDLVKENGLSLRVLRDATEALELKPELVVLDPMFTASLLPWHNFLRARFLLRSLREHCPGLRCFPEEARLCCAALEFRDLWKIRAEVGTVEGFRLQAFDRIQQKAITDTDEPVEPQPLWEYPAKLVSNVTYLATLSFGNEDVSHSVNLPIEGANGVAFWLEWELGNGRRLSTGLLGSPYIGQETKWEPLATQGVFLIPPKMLKKSLEISVQLDSRDDSDIVLGFKASA